MKLKKIFCTFVVAMTFAVPSFALNIPQEVVSYIKTECPRSVVRFDGLIVLADGTEYLPVLPAIARYNEGMKVKWAVPRTTSLKTLPDIVVFENNFALMKLIKTQNGTVTVKNLNDYPLEVKTGMLPQELVVPHGLILPEELRGILGNLEIPLYPIASISPVQNGSNKGQATSQTKSKNVQLMKTTTRLLKNGKTYKKDSPKTTVNKANQPSVLQKKRYLITNLNSEYINIVPSYAADPQFTLKLESIPLDTAITTDDAFLLISKINNTKIDLVDIRHEEIIKKIDLEVQPNEILISPDNRLAFITSLSDHSIFILDIAQMKIIQKIKVQGMPEKLALSSDGSRLIYYDKMASKLYCVELNDKYICTLVDTYPNASKFLYDNEYVYALLRQSNELSIKRYTPPRFSGDEKSVKQAEKIRLQGDNLTREEIANQQNNSQLLGSTDTMVYSKSNQQAKGTKTQPTLSYKDKNAILPLIVVPDKEDENKQQKIQVGTKPVDMLKYGKFIYILSTTDKKLSIFDISSSQVVKEVKLPVRGFPKKITRIGTSNIALITNVVDSAYVVFDLSKAEILDIAPINIPINNILVIQDL